MPVFSNKPKTDRQRGRNVRHKRLETVTANAHIAGCSETVWHVSENTIPIHILDSNMILNKAIEVGQNVTKLETDEPLHCSAGWQ